MGRAGVPECCLQILVGLQPCKDGPEHGILGHGNGHMEHICKRGTGHPLYHDEAMDMAMHMVTVRTTLLPFLARGGLAVS